jgi:hypothetical protein
MNPVTIGLDALLALLLIAALVMGARLNGRLKSLRESYAGFAQAVGDLDAAAQKADSALKALHVASEEAHDSLLGRIDAARVLVTKLEKAGEAAEKATLRAEDAAARAATLPSAASSVAPRRSLNELLAARDSRVAAADSGLRLEPRLDVKPDSRPEPRSERAAPALLPTPRRRPTADEDLFADAEDGVRPGLAGLMRLSLARSR